MELGGKKALQAEERPVMLSCDIHPWMKGRIAVFDHPYFALTRDDGTFEIKDAPAGDYLIYIQHEMVGWLHAPREFDKDKGTGGKAGQPITIPADGTLDLGKIEFQAAFLPAAPPAPAAPGAPAIVPPAKQP